MDSVSQIALGAALGELVLGRAIGRRAAVLGAVLGTLPDLDVLVPYADAIDTFTRHRSWSHSAFVLTAASLPLAAIARRVVGGDRDGVRDGDGGNGRGRPAQVTTGDASAGDPEAASARVASPPFARWWFGVWLVLVTHPMLDCFTLYGTQFWWPLPVRPVAIGSVFIIDPLYTLPLLVGVGWLWRRRSAAARRANVVGLAASTAYLGLTLLVQAHVARVARASLAAEGLDAAPLLVAPLPLSLLWRVVALDGDTYREGWRSLLDDEPLMTFDTYDRGRSPSNGTSAFPSLARLAWFTDGFARTRERDGELVATDLRMGAESNYVFSFVVGARDDPDGWRPIVARELPPEIDVAALRRVVRRVVDEYALRD